MAKIHTMLFTETPSHITYLLENKSKLQAQKNTEHKQSAVGKEITERKIK